MPSNINKNALFAKVRKTLSNKPESLGSLRYPAIKPSNVLGGTRKKTLRNKKSRKIRRHH